MKGSTLTKKIISSMLMLVTLISISSPAKAQAATLSYTTHSPLLSGDTMAVDEIDPWELTCFGIFMSNFCVPFVDSYTTAFSSTTDKGSKGAGLHALKFATGGDISSDSVVSRMTTYVMSTLASNYHPLVVKNFAVESNGTGMLEIHPKSEYPAPGSVESTIETRQAYLSDLLPMVAGIFYDNSTFDYSVSDTEVWGHPWLAGDTINDWESDITDFHITHGVLGKFYVSKDGTTIAHNKEVFDMTDGWDIQLPSQCLLYAAHKFKDDSANFDSIYDLVHNAAKHPLYIDSIGNIGVYEDGSGIFIIIIPAYLNQHITSEPMINLTNAIVLNTLSASTDKLNVASNVVGVRAVNNDKNDAKKSNAVANAGLGGIVGNNATLQAGTSVLYNVATDYQSGLKTTSPGTVNGYDYYIADATFKSFIDSGFDLTSHLRWSTLVKHTSDTSSGLDIQNYCQTPGKADSSSRTDSFLTNGGSGTAFNVNTNLAFNYDTHWEAVIKPLGVNIGNTSKTDKVIETYSVFQTAAQLYVPHVNSDNKNIKAYYKQLHGSSANEPLIAGINSNSEDNNQQSKKFIAYVPYGLDFSYLTNSDVSWWHGIGGAKYQVEEGKTSPSAIYKILRMSAAAGIDMYHGLNYGLDDGARRRVAQAVAAIAPSYAAAQQNAIDVFNDDLMLASNVIYNLANPNYQVTVGTNVKDLRVALVEDVLGMTYSGKDLNTKTNDRLGTMAYRLNAQWARIAAATDTFKVAASYLGLRESTAFSLYASDMYYTYLDMYGFIEGKHIFDIDLFTALGSDVATISSSEMGKKIMTQGLTAEQKEQVLKDNAYLMLSTDEDGREYRSRMVSGMVEEWLVDVYDKTCYGDSDSAYFQTLTSTSKSFIVLPTYAENWTTEWVVEHWGTILPIIMIFLLVLVAAFGTLNGKKLPWILANLLISACMLVVLPAAAEIAPYLVEKVSDSAFKDVIGTMAISEAVEDETIKADIEKQFSDYGDQISAAVKSLSAMGTSGSLMLKQDMTRKVIPNTTTEKYAELKGLASAQWLLPNLLSMSGADKESERLDYVYRAVGEKRAELKAMIPSLNGADATKANNALATLRGAAGIDLLPMKDIDTAEFSSSSYRHGEKHTSKPNYNISHMSDLILHTTANNDWPGIDTGYRPLLFDINSYSGEESYTNTVGYLQGTETLLPYFYLVAYDLLITANEYDSLDNITSLDYFNCMRHIDNSGQYENKLTLSNGSVRDVVDLEFLFSTYIPYLVNMQNYAKYYHKEQKIGSDYDLYFEEPIAFLYECNWADKIINAYDFGDDVIPETYATNYGRNMVFSRTQMNAENLSSKELTEVELRCIEINEEIDKQWTLLLNYTTTPGVTSEILAEQMALTATIAFNEIMSKDRVVNSNYALYPNAVSLRSINLDTMLKLVLMSNFGLADVNQNSMKIVLAESGVITGFILLLLATLVTYVIPWIVEVTLGVVFYTSIVSSLYNAAVDGKDKLKTCGGAAITSLVIAAETCAYVYFYALIIGNTNKVLSIEKLQAGTTLATGKIFAILAVTILFSVLLVLQAYKNVVNFRDMGAQMWMSYSKKSYEAVTTFFKNFASKVKGAIKHTDPTAAAMKDAMDGVEVQAKLDDEVKVKNTAADPLFTKDANSSSEATYIWGSEDESDNSGYILNPHHRDPALQTDDKSSGSTTKTESSDESKDA